MDLREHDSKIDSEILEIAAVLVAATAALAWVGFSVFAYDVTATKNDGRTSEPSARAFADLKNKTPYDPGTTSIDGIGTTEGDVQEVARYTIDGVRLSAPAKGINIIRYSDGTTKKVIVK